ncbi:MAG: DUF3291 domain-containing protein [Alphaproteobacteria bacterium]|nr:hypothetical protein [Hyphomonas sp.]MBR9807111.1 DUF3291 domain-containing protein [Alphaproteobacteria bacterium]|tara:strand:- start:2866 stop:3360 length:495 start_codon:yes stop_codon:yes gene_type:complete
MNKEYRLIHFNCARPFGEFNFDNEFVRVFMAILPRIFTDADQFEGLRWHSHGVRRPDAEWRGMNDALPHPEGMGMPDICTMAVWTGIEALKEFTYSGRTHPPGMRRLATQLDRSQGASFVLWWAPRSQSLTLEDGWNKLMHLREHGPTDQAFTLDHLKSHPAAA